MDARTCIQKLRLIASVVAATVDASGSPQVRTIGVMHAEGEELYFLTARGKPFYRELIATKKVQLLGLSRFKEMIRFDGAPERLPQEEQDFWREEIFAENPCMDNVYPGASRSILDIFRLRRGVIEYFDLGVHPIFRETYELGGAAAKPKGYETGDSCSGCGICRLGSVTTSGSAFGRLGSVATSSAVSRLRVARRGVFLGCVVSRLGAFLTATTSHCEERNRESKENVLEHVSNPPNYAGVSRRRPTCG